MAAWYNGIGVAAFPGVAGGGKGAITDLHQLWDGLLTSTAVATTRVTAQGLLGNTLQENTSPPACNQVALVAWKNGLTDLGNAAKAEMTVTVVGPPGPTAVQDAKDGFDQLGIVTQQGQLATTAAG
jgi:hypothetical protein